MLATAPTDDLPGIHLDALAGPLLKVPAEHEASPVATFEPLERMGPHARAYMEAYYGEDAEFKDACTRMPLKAYARLTFDELNKVRYSSPMMMAQCVEDLFDKDPSYFTVDKIRNSIWQLGYSRARWNDMVDAYDGIRSFDLGVDGFEVRLDMTTGTNIASASVHSRTFLDGIFAYLVFYRGEHVMTIGFSFIADRGLLIQQVQLKQPRGNRWLFRWPANRLEHIIERFRAAFPTHTLYVVDGADLTKKIVANYQGSLDRALHFISDYQNRIDRGIGDADDNARTIERHRENATGLDAKIAGLKADKKRLAALYKNIGSFERGRSIKKNDMRHYEVIG